MIWIGGTAVFRRMASYAGIRCIIVITVMTNHTIVCYRRMSSCKRINSIVVKIRWTPCIVRMAFRTIGRELIGLVVRIGGTAVIC